jgi:type I restriction enzyme S subunit
VRHRKEFVTIDDIAKYKRCRVQLHAKGVVLRDIVAGAEIKTKEQQVCRPGEFLVAEIDAKVGGFGVVPEGLDGAIVSSHYFLFTIDDTQLDRRFLDYFTRTPAFREQVNAQGSTNYAAIRPTRMLKYAIPLPPLPEQRRIVAKVEELAAKIEEARGLAGHNAVDADAIFASHLNELVGNPYETRTGKWMIAVFAKIGDLSRDVADGPHVTPAYVDDGVPFITVLNITSGRVVFRGCKTITAADHALLCRRARAERGDVLISKDGTLGIPCYVDTDRGFSFFVSVALIKPKRDQLDGEFLTWVLRAPYLQDRIKERSRGDMIRHLVLREIRELLVPVPPLSEQRRIVAYLDDLQAKVDSLKALQAQTAAELDALLPSVLDRAFKGEL